MDNFPIIDGFLTEGNREFSKFLDAGPIADIGAADGDVSLFLHSLGYEVDVIDNGSTNWNGLRGARLLAEDAGPGITVHEVNLDTQFRLPRQYGLVFFLGILYHLQNPFYALQQLAMSTQFALLSTRIAAVTQGGLVRLDKAPVAYLLASDECNNDATNYWIFSELGLRRLLDRTGWDILEFAAVGCQVDSEPADMAKDERAFCLIKSRNQF